jgi:isopenicillin N synthase-like dioxygenase
MTGGLYKSTLHRVKVQTSTDRFSYPFFFDPNLDSKVSKIENLKMTRVDEGREKKIWDDELRGTYGEYLLKKISKALPQVAQNEK